MRPKKIIELIKIFESHAIDELQISRWGTSIRISKCRAGGNSHPADTVQVNQGKTELPEISERPLTTVEEQTVVEKNQTHYERELNEWQCSSMS